MTRENTDSWFLESNGKKVKWDFSLMRNRPTRGWDYVSTGLFFLLPVILINLQVLPDSDGMLCSLVDPCLFGDTGIEPEELDL
jgi:hypothetical protein